MNIGKKSGLDIDQMTQVVISNSSNVWWKIFQFLKWKKQNLSRKTHEHTHIKFLFWNVKWKKIQKTKQEDIVSCVILAAS